ncbi:MAG: SIS domain-containing protein, partial [Smithellaceae bacterium]|nr:SIS domain-containing protein [Smithellaceae bacterium]
DGTPLTFTEENIGHAEITTRDIDRGAYPHFFLKEINESISSVRKTLRGKYRLTNGEAGRKVVFNLGSDVVPEDLKKALRDGNIARICVIGHGTAAVAGAAVTDSLERYLKGSRIKVEGKIASELSGFCLENDLRDALIIPITQSGTTTDTNRAVAMAAERGATVVAIVNRRQSDITAKSHGVFYTSDGRDIEMSVASTKAFYSQIIAGHILSLFIAQLAGTLRDEEIAEELLNLEQAPEAMKRVLEKKEQIKKSVELLAKRRRYWAVVGSGPNKAAADEIRIKLSELCYKTISSDVVENKKHIDLSAEPLIIVCAAGNPEAVMGDVVKDVAIFKAHKAGVVVFTDEGENRFTGIAETVITVPRCAMPLPVIMNTLAGHLWGYYAACSIDRDAAFLKEFRSRLSEEMSEQAKKNYTLYERIADRKFRNLVSEFAGRFHELREEGAFSVTSTRTISDLILLLKYNKGKLPIEDFWQEFKVADGTASPADLLDRTLGVAVDELARPIDAIRHQAKTVTVGTSRKEQPLRGIIFDLLHELGFSARNLVAKNIITIGKIQAAIAKVTGYTFYRIDNLDVDGNPWDGSQITIEKRCGVSQNMRSRADVSPKLMGTKRTIVSTGHVYVGKGKYDGASIVIVPLWDVKMQVRNLLLIHVGFNETLSVPEKIAALGYRYNDIRNLVNEYNLPWEDRYLEEMSLESLLSDPFEDIASRIKKMLE